jgi:DNA polymerase-3 subunit delta
MARIGEAELKEQIKSGEFQNVYFIWGEESYLKEYYVKKLKEKLAGGAFSDFNFHQYEAKNSSMDDILQDAQTLPMMSDYTFILVHDYPLNKSSADVDALKEFFKDIPETCVLVFWFDNIDVDPKKESKWKTIEGLFAKAGCSAQLEKRSESDIAKLIVASAKKRNCTIDGSNARYLISVSGNDIQTLFSELEKICAYASGREITKQDIDSLAVKSLQARVYDLSKFILASNGDGAYSVLNTLFAQKEEPISILAVISSCYIDMYRVKCAKAANVNENEIASIYSYKGREFLIRNASRDCRNISFEALRQSIDALQKADELMKSSSVDKNVLLEQTIAKLLLLRNK